MVDEAAYFIELCGKFSCCLLSRLSSHTLSDYVVTMMLFLHKHVSLGVYFSLLHSLVTIYSKNGNFLEASYLLSMHAKSTKLNDDDLPGFDYGLFEKLVFKSTGRITTSCFVTAGKT